MNEINKHINNINKHMDNINKHLDNINKELFYKRVYSVNPNYYDIDILNNNFLIREKNCIEKIVSGLECINMNLLRYIHFLNKQCCVLNITYNNTINFILQHKLELTQLLGKFVLVYNENMYNINLIKKKLNIINLTCSMFIPFKTQYLQDL
jgi:hypothetical protein